MENGNSAIIKKIEKLKKSRNAIFLVHNYQLGEVQDIADFSGDSLELSRKAAVSNADVIVFCGVHFMAETAAILCPEKIVLLPELHAGCPMADMVTAKRLKELKNKHPHAKVVCYVNSTAEVKAESDICCTSANAVKVVESLKDAEEIIFVPDQYLGSYAAEQSGRDLILWPGYCPTHARIRPEDILKRKQEYPQAKVIVHPECKPETRVLADAVLSTGGMVKYAHETDARELIIGTEIGILYRLRKENPEKLFIPVTEQAVCPRMKLITLETVLWSLENMKNQITVPESIRLKAKIAVDRMLEVK
jgi:quinolinate synthase